MADLSELRRKFPPRDPQAAARQQAAHQAAQRIAREYQRKRTELGLGEPPALRRGRGYYVFLIFLMIAIGVPLVGVLTGKVGFSKARIDRAQLQAEKSVAALATAVGRYRYHVGRYPTAAEGLEELARLRPGLKGWNGPYVKKVVNDPWGHPYEYVAEGEVPVVFSRGADGVAGTADDIRSTAAMVRRPQEDTAWTQNWVPYQLRGYVLARNEAEREAIRREVARYQTASNAPSDAVAEP